MTFNMDMQIRTPWYAVAAARFLFALRFIFGEKRCARWSGRAMARLTYVRLGRDGVWRRWHRGGPFGPTRATPGEHVSLS